MTIKLKAMSVEDFQYCFYERGKRLLWCVTSQENYSEGDNVDLELRWDLNNLQNQYDYSIDRPCIYIYIYSVCDAKHHQVNISRILLGRKLKAVAVLKSTEES